MIPKDPYNKLATSLYYYFPSDKYSSENNLEPFNFYDKLGYSSDIFPCIEWGSSQNYKDIDRNFDNIKQNFTDKGFPVIIDEVGIYNDYIKKIILLNNFYILYSMSYEYEGILPCLWDLPMTSSNYKNFYFNKRE